MISQSKMNERLPHMTTNKIIKIKNMIQQTSNFNFKNIVAVVAVIAW